MPLARISLTLSRHFSLSFIASGRSSMLHLVSSHCCCCERELENEQNCNILKPTLMAISVSFPLSRVAQPEAWGPTLLGAGFLYRILSPTCLVSKTGLQNSDFLSSLSYIIAQSPTQYLWNGMFDRHQAEITVMQFTGHSLPVHQFMTVLWDFTLSHIVSQARLRDFFP